jgi:flagellar biosynthesis/type III secretory pathway chaperone
MHQLIKQLYDLLQDECSQYDALVQLLREEGDALRHVRFGALPDIIARKDTAQIKIQQCEHQRHELVRSLAAKLDCTEEDFRLSMLYPHIPAKGRDLLESLRDALTRGVEEVRRQTANTQQAADSMMMILHDTMDYIARQSGARPNVSYAGKVRPAAGRSIVQSVVLSRQI